MGYGLGYDSVCEMVYVMEMEYGSAYDLVCETECETECVTGYSMRRLPPN